MYSEKIMNEFYNPEHYGVIRGASGVGKVVCDTGSEILKIFISVDAGKIVDAQFQAFGGVVAIALASYATNFIYGKSVKDAQKLDGSKLVELSGPVPEEKRYLIEAAVNCAQAAIESLSKKGLKNAD